MTEAVERLGNLRSFLNAWDDPQHWLNGREVPLRTTAYGNINATGEIGDYSGHAVTQWQYQFDGSIEHGARLLVRALVNDWRWITFTSCEGHHYPNGQLQSVPRHVGLLPRNHSEEHHIRSVLLRARENVTALHGPSSVRISVTSRPLQDPTMNADAGQAVFLTFNPRAGAADYIGEIDQATQRFVDCLALLPDRIEFDKLRETLLWECGPGAEPPYDAGHCSRVERIGLRMAHDTDADVTVVRLFSMFHDSCRSHGGHEPNQGTSAAELTRRLIPGFCSVHPRRALLLQEACKPPTMDDLSDDPTIGTCWDADRLDLACFGVAPNSGHLSTAVAHTDEMKNFALAAVEHVDAHRAPPEISSFFSEDAVYHISADPDIAIFAPRAYWRMDWSVSGSVGHDDVPDGATIFECVYATSFTDVPFYVCPPRIRRVRLDVQRAQAKEGTVRCLLHGVAGPRFIIFDSQDREALAPHTCTIYRFSKDGFELFPNGEYGSSQALAPEATFLCSDWMRLVKAFGYHVLLLDDLETVVRRLLLEDIPFESEGFETIALAHRALDVCEPPETRLRAAVSELRELTPDELKSPDALSAIIRRAGLTFDDRDIYGADASFMVLPPGGLYQSPRQLADLLVYLSDRDVTSVIEIGAGAGWTTVVMAAYLERFHPHVRCVGIDIHDTFAVQADVLTSVRCEFRKARSAQMQSTRFDFCLIDGDHSYDAVMTDFDNVGRQSAICAFHDIHDEWCPGVRRAWHELREQYSNREFRGDLDHVDRMGIGVLELRPTLRSDTGG